MPSELIERAGPWTLLVGVLLALLSAFMRGTLVSGAEHRRQLQAVQDERDTWRSMAFAEQQSRQQLEVTGRIVRTAFQARPEAPSEAP